MPIVRFENEGLEVEVPNGANLREVATANGVQVKRSALDCKGHGYYGCNCRVWVRGADDSSNPPTFWEKLPFRDRTGQVRLSCQVEVRGDLTVITQP